MPIIRKELRDLRCCDGDAVSLECKVYAPTEQPNIRWEKEGKVSNNLIVQREDLLPHKWNF